MKPNEALEIIHGSQSCSALSASEDSCEPRVSFFVPPKTIETKRRKKKRRDSRADGARRKKSTLDQYHSQPAIEATPLPEISETSPLNLPSPVPPAIDVTPSPDISDRLVDLQTLDSRNLYPRKQTDSQATTDDISIPSTNTSKSSLDLQVPDPDNIFSKVPSDLSNESMLSVMGQCNFWSIWQEREDNVPEPKDVVVAVETAAIACSRDSYTLDVFESYCVGVVTDCGPVAQVFGFAEGTRVASLEKHRSHSRHISVPPKRLMPVPQNLDAADIASLLSTYLPAFLALHHGRPRPDRYRRNCLRGRKVFVTGGVSAEAIALARLAKLSGASEVCLSASAQHLPGYATKRIRVVGDDPDKWAAVLEKRMDLVVDYSFPRGFSSVRKTLARKGRLVCAPKGPLSMLSSFFEQCELSTIKRASLFNFDEYFEMHRDEVWQDMNFLLQLLSTRQIRPDIDRFVSPKDLASLRAEISSKPMYGTIICEPWK